MHTNVRRFIKTAIGFLFVGLLIGAWMLAERELGGRWPGPYVVSAHAHAVQLGFVMFLILWRYRRHPHAAGWLFGLYGVLAGAERFVIEFFRAKDDRFAGPFTLAQMIAIAIAVAGAAWMMNRRRPARGSLAAAT